MQRAVLLGLVLLLPFRIASAQSTWIGPANGLWSDPVNWSPTGVPANGGGSTYNVIIPGGSWIDFDLVAPTQISGASLESNSRIDLSDSSLEVLGVALLNHSLITVSGPSGAFLTHAPFAAATSPRVYADSGALARIGSNSYVLDGVPGADSTQMSAIGVGSVLDFSSASSIDASSASNGGGSWFFEVLAADGGEVDFSAVTTMSGAGADDWLRFRSQTGGMIDFASLVTVTGGRTWFSFDGGDVTLPLLKSAINTRLTLESGGFLSLPALQLMDGGQVVLGAGATAQFDGLHTFDDGFVSYDGNGGFYAPNLASFEKSFIELGAGNSFVTGPLSEIDDARILVGPGGLSPSVVDSDYYLTESHSNSLYLGAEAATLDLSSVTLIDGGSLSNGGGQWWHDIRASANGVIDLSGAVEVRGAGSDEWIRFRVESGGSIQLPQLMSIPTGRVWFDVDGGGVVLSSLANAMNTRFDVSAFQVLDLPELVSLTSGWVNISPGGMFIAPLLTDFERGKVHLTPTTIFEVGDLSQIDDAVISVSGGREFTVVDTDYVFLSSSSNSVYLGAEGVGSGLHLSEMDTVDGSALVNGGGSWWHDFRASDGAAITLPNLETIRGAGSDDWVRLNAEGGRVHCGSIQHVSGGLWIRASGVGGVLVSDGDVELGLLGSNGRLEIDTFGILKVTGGFRFGILQESRHDTANGTLQLHGSTIQHLEVAGADLGLPVGVIPDNFNWGQMVVGQDDQATTVVLMDEIDNGNRGSGGEAELLYLSGFPADDGLDIRGGATLVLNGIQVYAFIGNVWTDVNALIPAGEEQVAFGGGFIRHTLPPAVCLHDIDGDDQVGFSDLVSLLSTWGPCAGCPADLDGDDAVGFSDLVALLAAWGPCE